MRSYDIGRSGLIDQQRGLIKDQSDTRTTQGIVYAVNANDLDIQIGASGNVIHRVPSMGGTNAILAGDLVYLIYFGQQPVAISTRSYSSGVSSPGVAAHTHDTRYYTEGIVDAKLAGKSDLSHTHSPIDITAKTGHIGKWTIDADGIYDSKSRLSGLGYISFGNSPSTNWGYPNWSTNYGVWIGWDYGITDLAHSGIPIYQNDPAGGTTAAGPKMAFYSDTTGSGGEVDYLLWTGTKLLVKAKNFTLDGSGNITATNVTLTGTITATSGSIGHWSIVSNKIQSVSGSIIMDADAESITLGSGLLLDGANKRIQSVPFTTGTNGFQLNGNTGSAEFENVTARGEIRASAFTIGEISAIGGSFVVLAAAPLYQDINT